MENTVVINSIGTASPKVSKVLSEAFKIPQDFMLKLLYTAPSVLFQKVDEELATKAEETLSKLGLEVSVLNKKETLNISKNLVDVSIYFENISNLPTVIEQLSDFLGCKQAEALNALLNQPSIILGDVSIATAEALQKRINASVCYSNPKEDLFTIAISKDISTNTLKTIEKRLNKTAKTNNGNYIIENINYSECSTIWRDVQSKKQINIINQTHQLVNIKLTSFNPNNKDQVQFLTKEVGMPSEILTELKNNLPVILFENISAKKAKYYNDLSKGTGISINIKKQSNTKKHIAISNIKDSKEVLNILSQYIDVKNLKMTTSWKSEEAFPALIARYLHKQLEQLDCNPKMI